MVKEIYVVDGKEYNLKEAIDLLKAGKWESCLKSISKTTGAKPDVARKIAIPFKEEIDAERFRRQELVAEAKGNLLTTSGYNFEGYRIVKYVGVMTAECALGTGFLTEFTGNWMDSLGAESGMFGNKIRESRNTAYNRLVSEAVEKGCNALIGVDYQYFTVSKNIVCVCIKGTGVVVEKM